MRSAGLRLLCGVNAQKRGTKLLWLVFAAGSMRGHMREGVGRQTWYDGYKAGEQYEGDWVDNVPEGCSRSQIVMRA